MPDSDLLILWLNVGGAATACLANVWAGLTGWSDWRWLRLTIATLSAVYVVAYAVLAFGMYPIEVWSPFMRGVSVPVWFIVWVWPAVHSAHVLRRLRLHVQREQILRGK